MIKDSGNSNHSEHFANVEAILESNYIDLRRLIQTYESSCRLQ